MMFVRFLAVIVTWLALVAPASHLFVLPNKIGIPADQYFVVQGIYRGWWMVGLLLPAAVLTNAAAPSKNVRRFRERSPSFSLKDRRLTGGFDPIATSMMREQADSQEVGTQNRTLLSAAGCESMAVYDGRTRVSSRQSPGLHWTPTHLLSYRYGAIGQGRGESLT